MRGGREILLRFFTCIFILSFSKGVIRVGEGGCGRGKILYVLFNCTLPFLQQVDAVIAASKSVTSSKSFRKVLEVTINFIHAAYVAIQENIYLSRSF